MNLKTKNLKLNPFLAVLISTALLLAAIISITAIGSLYQHLVDIVQGSIPEVHNRIAIN